MADHYSFIAHPPSNTMPASAPEHGLRYDRRGFDGFGYKLWRSPAGFESAVYLPRREAAHARFDAGVDGFRVLSPWAFLAYAAGALHHAARFGHGITHPGPERRPGLGGGWHTPDAIDTLDLVVSLDEVPDPTPYPGLGRFTDLPTAPAQVFLDVAAADLTTRARLWTPEDEIRSGFTSDPTAAT